jgi:hypothetical protein
MDNNKINDKEESSKTHKTDNIIRCEICGTSYHKSNKARHEQTRKHKDVKYIWIDRIEITR